MRRHLLVVVLALAGCKHMGGLGHIGSGFGHAVGGAASTVSHITAPLARGVSHAAPMIGRSIAHASPAVLDATEAVLEAGLAGAIQGPPPGDLDEPPPPPPDGADLCLDCPDVGNCMSCPTP